MKRVKAKHSFKNQVRIIGGLWRSRKIDFPNIAALRPTPDRVRETVFNWLAPHIVGAHCLDLFAGSGVLGFEALSRGAARATFIDASPEVIWALRDHARRFDAEDKVEISRFYVPDNRIFRTSEGDIKMKWDIVFLDPPFRKNYIELCSTWLEESGCLSDHALLYIEVERSLDLSKVMPVHWSILRHCQAGQVGYYLVMREEARACPGSFS